MGLFEDWQNRTRIEGKQKEFLSFTPHYIDDYPFTKVELNIITRMLVTGGFEIDPSYGLTDSHGENLEHIGLIVRQGNKYVLTARGKRIAKKARSLGY
jgi:hypothetical protein